MTVYVALQAVRDGRITMDTPFVMSQRAARAVPSKMGFNPGTEVTLDNALKMLMVKSANDLAIMIAEGVSGSVEDFAVEMNRAPRRSACGNRISSIRTGCSTPIMSARRATWLCSLAPSTTISRRPPISTASAR